MLNFIKLSTALLTLVTAMSFGSARPNSKTATNPYGFEGAGTIQDPYLVSSLDDLIIIKEQVNKYRNTFDGVFFKQTVDFDFSNLLWEGIGNVYQSIVFRGIYNGDGHTISNLNSNRDDNCNALFGLLGGICFNLGIESGYINGNACGSIASHSPGDGSGLIFNCYNKATIQGNRAGGIADNFTGGRIANCVNLGDVYGPLTGGITTIGSSNVYYSGSKGMLFSNEFTGAIVDNFIVDERWDTKKIADKLNSTIELACNLSGMEKTLIRYYSVDENGELCFGDLYKQSFFVRNAKTLYWVTMATGLVACTVPFVVVYINKKKASKNEK